MNIVNNDKVFYIITTRNINASNDGRMVVISLSNINRQEAKIYIKNMYLVIGLNENEIESLLESLLEKEHEVYAYRLEQLVAYVRDNPLLDINMIIRNTKKNKFEIDLFESIKEKSKISWKILKYLAFIDPDRIKPNQIETIMNMKIDEIIEDINLISNSALIKIEPKTKTISIHRLTQKIIKEQLKDKKRRKIINELIEKINEIVPKVDEVPGEKWDIIKEWIEHMKTLMVEELNER